MNTSPSAKPKKSRSPADAKPSGGPGRKTAQDFSTEGYTLPQMVKDLRKYQAELEVQNKALRYSQLVAEGASERFLALFSNVPLALMVVDEQSLVLESNAMALRLFRPLESDPVLSFLLPMVRLDHRERVARSFVQAKLEGTSEIPEIVFSVGADGSLHGDLHIARVENPQDELAHFICAFIDQQPLLAERHALRLSASALQQRNEELHLSENRLAAIINSSLDAIICVDDGQTISVFNPAASALFQCQSEEAIGCPLVRFLPEAVRALNYTQISSHAQLGEMEGLTASGRVLAVEVSVSCERHELGNITTIFARDHTARKKVETQRNVLEKQLRESQKMQAIGTMAGGIAHDFNNILGAILGNVDLARQDAGVDSPAQESLGEIEKAGRRARDLVRQILTFSRNESPRRNHVYLADVMHETVRLLRVGLPPHVELRVTIHPNTPPVLADETQVEQALLNLCTNAIQAIGAQRGLVTIELGSGQPEAGEVERRESTREHYVTLAVRDTGGGIDPETLQRVFEPFFTTKPLGQGTGLGLAVVHGVMRAHLGTVGVRSTLGNGSIFTLYFPPAQPEDVAPEVPLPRIATAQGQGQHIMYVDDDQALVFLVARALTRKGYKVSTFTDPHLACAALRAQPQDYDLLVTDYNMPGYCGVDLLLEARAIRPDLPVALASGYVTAEIEQKAFAAGASALIHKPNDVEELCETVQQLLMDSEAAWATPAPQGQS